MLPSFCRLLILLSIGIISWKTGSKFLEYTFFTASWFKHISKTTWPLNAAVPRKRSFLGQFLGNYQDRSVALQRPILKIWDPTLKVSWCDTSLILLFATQCHLNDIFSGWQSHQKGSPDSNLVLVSSSLHPYKNDIAHSTQCKKDNGHRGKILCLLRHHTVTQRLLQTEVGDIFYCKFYFKSALTSQTY